MFAYVLLLLAVVAVIVWLRHTRGTCRIVTAHVINMDKSQDRLAEFQKKAAAAGLTVTRWAGVNGAALSIGDAEEKGIPNEIYTRMEKQKGVLGCYLAHKTLLDSLRTMDCAPSDVHLIFEDDAEIPADFFQKWESTCAVLPAEWDGIQLGVSRPRLLPFHGHVHRPSTELGNWGLFAYAIRHAALPKICNDLKTMRAPVDSHFQQNMQAWRWFICYPEVVPHDFEFESGTTGKFYNKTEIEIAKSDKTIKRQPPSGAV